MKKLSKTIIIIAYIFIIVGTLLTFIKASQFRLKLIGKKTIQLELNEEFKEPGFNATLKKEDAKDKVIIKSNVNNKKIGTYEISYTLNYKNFSTVKKRIVKVIDSFGPTIVLKDKNPYDLNYKSKYVEPGFTASDKTDGDITDKVKVVDNIISDVMGEYFVSYCVNDTSNNNACIKRIVRVRDIEAPLITLKGNKDMYIALNQKYVEPGFTAIDNLDGDVSSNVSVEYNVNPSIMGSYHVTYTAKDKTGNTASITRRVNVLRFSTNTYIEVDINKQKLTYYKNGKVFLVSDIVSGTKGRSETRTGTFKINKKARDTYLVGADYKSFVSYWMSFYNNSQGFHDARWRNSFGGKIYLTNGSHGCVNLPLANAKKLYENISVGTKVYIYK